MARKNQIPKEQPAAPEQAKPAEPEMDPGEIGILIRRTVDGAKWQLTRVHRGADGRFTPESKGLLPRQKFLLELVRELDRLRDHVWKGQPL